MNKQIKETLQAITRSLPPLVSTTMNVVTRVKGKDLIAAWKGEGEPKDAKGLPIDPKHTYMFIDPMPIDHLKNLIEVYRNKGTQGVEDYKEKIKKIYVESLAEQANQQTKNNDEKNNSEKRETL